QGDYNSGTVRFLRGAVKACRSGVRRCHLISYQEDGSLLQELFPQEQAERYLEFLKGYLIPKYAEFICKEIQTAYLESYSEYGQ
ncbi:hypothetical protein ONO39_27830, partial [Salmonella enterica subsp. enterica serovar Anatum]|nr:hypothetical protein [Salmonella enterica subsp. enterica serovar Anatum]